MLIRAILCGSCHGCDPDRKQASGSDVRCAYNPALVCIEVGAVTIKPEKCTPEMIAEWWRF